MDADRLAALFPEDDDQFLKFDLISEADRLHPSRRLCGLLKIAELMREPESFGFSSEHDVVYLANADDLREITPDEAVYLSRCGVHYEDDVECLAMFC